MKTFSLNKPELLESKISLNKFSLIKPEFLEPDIGIKRISLRNECIKILRLKFGCSNYKKLFDDVRKYEEILYQNALNSTIEEYEDINTLEERLLAIMDK